MFSSLVAVIAGVALLTVSCSASIPRDTDEFLVDAWDAYKRLYIHADGYIVDRTRGGGEVTSEGQGYALLRAVWMRDVATFDRVHAWTERHLQRSDGLYSWRWTPAAGGSVLDANTATDADQEIAFALVLAAETFGRPRLLDRARELLQAIRRVESISVGNGWFPAAGNWAVGERIVNLSYFVPYAHPYFARIDPDGRWNVATTTGYDLLARVLALPSVQLVPDFVRVTETGGIELLDDDSTLSRDFTSDAMRLLWRVAFDCRLHAATRACVDPLGADSFRTLLARDGRLYTRYRVDGSPIERIESLSFNAMALPFLQLHAPDAARELEVERLSSKVIEEVVQRDNRYYDANWVWFGLALADGFLVEAMRR